ncbi:cyclopropane-fatty-acyl-phospholipid synthase [Bombardia bombarda]|uniref:Cyclopropane-fatty-acyl-phospholipid synthase n=1 Tax=Bombardia bombarda TaxID=252184 RepID=A0AA39XK41_9PEZI|nr:cyclopropane-fatty-acyl-phospholipid synthase [Bombardia bombarda]
MNYDALLDTVLDSGYLPHAVIRRGIRYQLRQRLGEIATYNSSLGEALARKMAFVAELRASPIAIETATANQQHYEVGTELIKGMLGPRMKYSACLYPTGKETLAEAEVAMLEEYVVRGQLEDGMRILDLGCGWGSAALYFAEKLPKAQVVAFSNSKTQKAYIDGRAKAQGLANIEVITGDVADYEFEHETFDRVVSIEMFEHMKNYESLLAKVSRALKPGGKFFAHIFCHKDTPYHFEDGWMTTHFFTGGTMISADLLLYFQKDLTVVNHWWVNGQHYSKSLEHWLSKMTANKKSIWPSLVETYGEKNAATWYSRWEIFYLACSELFNHDKGDTWGVTHILFEKQPKSS